MKASSALRIFSPRELESEVSRVMASMGTSLADGSWVAQLLVKANLPGHDSHGIIRVPQYFEAGQRGRIDPGTQPEITAEGIPIDLATWEGIEKVKSKLGLT